MPTNVYTTGDKVDQTIDRMPMLRSAGTGVKHAVHKQLVSNQAMRVVADLLHGKWLGHPLHPVLTDVTIGGWLMGGIFDLASIVTGRRKLRETADTLTTLGTISALPTAVAGLTDYSAIKQEAVETGAAHGALNGAAFLLYALSLRARATDNRGVGLVLSGIGLGLVTLSAWLGGELVFRHRVGVDHAQRAATPDTWTRIAADADILEGQLRRIDVDGQAVMVARHNGRVYAIGAACSHAGGPLDEGEIVGSCVQCPWHDSVYDLATGHVVHGPSTYSQPRYDVRIVNSQVELRAAEGHD